jgi:hypothetical protein
MASILWVLERAGMAHALAASVIAASVMASPVTGASATESSGTTAPVAGVSTSASAAYMPAMEPSGTTAPVAGVFASASAAYMPAMEPAAPGPGEFATETPEAEAQPREEPRTLELTKDEVIVRAPDGAVIQRIPFDPGALTEFNRAFFLTTPDINFDGYPDLLLIKSQGAQNIYYDGWIWDSAAERYVYDPQIGTLPSPFFDEKSRRIRTYEHGSATDHTAGVWEWMDGRLVEIWRQEQTYDIETGLFTIRTYERKDGELMLVREETLTEAQVKSR